MSTKRDRYLRALGYPGWNQPHPHDRPLRRAMSMRYHRLQIADLTPDEVFTVSGNDITRIQYDPAGGDDQMVELYAGEEYICGAVPADRPDLKAIIASRSGEGAK